MNFYNTVAKYYDRMTDVEGRQQTARNFVSELRQRYTFGSALDVACGTGLYAKALAELGVNPVVGVDISEKMLDIARRQADADNLSIVWRKVPMRKLACIGETFDIILCLGNSIPHILTHNDLVDTLNGFHDRLTPGGHCVLQVLNYDRILRDRERIVSINRHGNKEFVRFYDFHPPTVTFNLLTITWMNDDYTHNIQSTELYPYTRAELAQAMSQHGFRDLSFFNHLTFEPFEVDSSPTLTIIARREQIPESVNKGGGCHA
ncbi:MAG: class I SAM-dependent methyltransferase [Candidatus Pacebacteria bacterium]|nr:class I SAM-dependent methyltransferase [Candidatus Paceibacterota bacterium]